MTVLPLAPLHMGALHPVEQVLVLVLAFGPFLLLALVVWLRRRAERREEHLAASPTQGPTQSPTQGPSEGQLDR